MKIRLALLLSLIFSVASVAPSFAAGERYALVIGNAKYPDAEAPLKEPINDARDIADVMKKAFAKLNDAVARGDFNLIQGLVLLIAVISILVNLAVDMMYGFFDPRIRQS